MTEIITHLKDGFEQTALTLSEEIKLPFKL